MVRFMRKFAFFLLLALVAATPQTASVSSQDLEPTYVQRGEVAMLLVKNAGIAVDLEKRIDLQVGDIDVHAAYAPYLEAAVEQEIFSVDKDTQTLNPHGRVTRADFLEMLTKAFELTTGIPYSFSDVSSDKRIAAYAGLAWRYGLFDSGPNPLHLEPAKYVTHKEAAQAVYRLLQAEPSLQPKANMFPVAGGNQAKTVRPGLFSSLKKRFAKTAEQAQFTYTDSSTPKRMKSAMLRMVQSRDNLAQVTRHDVLQIVNAIRGQYNVAPLRSNAYLQRSAQRHAKDMALRGYFSHFTPEGQSYVDRIRLGGYLDVNPEACSCSQAFDLSTNAVDQGGDYLITGEEHCTCDPIFALGENLAKGQLSVEQVVEDWLNSPNHRRNLLRPEFKEIGIGLYEDIWVQNFGRLRFE